MPDNERSISVSFEGMKQFMCMLDCRCCQCCVNVVTVVAAVLICSKDIICSADLMVE